MSDDTIDAAHVRMAEQLMSDERVLGTLPEDAAGVLLDWALARLDAAAAAAADVNAFAAAADAIRRDMRAQADAAADRGDDAAALAAHLGSAPAVAAQEPDVEPQTTGPSAAEAAGCASCDDTRPLDQPNAVPSMPAEHDDACPSESASQSLWNRLRRFFAPHRGAP
jgi:hypothetical protein